MNAPHKTAALFIIALMLATSARAQQVVQNRTYESGEQEQRNSMESISTADSVVVKPSADVQWESLTKIHLTPGFHAQLGAKFDALVPDENAFVLVVLDGDNQSASPGAVNARPFDMAVWQHGGPVINMPVTFTVQSGGGSLLVNPSGGGASSLTLMSDIDGTVRVSYQQPTAANVTSVIHVTSNGKAIDLHSYNFATALATGNDPAGGNGNGSGSGGSGNSGNGANGKPPGWKIGPESDNPAGFVVFSPEGITTDVDAAGQASVLLTPAMTGATSPAPYAASASSTWSTQPASLDGPWQAFDQKNTATGGAINNQVGWQSANNKYAAPDYYGSEWIMVDLGSEKTLINYNLRSRGYSPLVADYNQFPRDFTLSVSTDGVTFTNIDSRTDVPQPTAWYQSYSFMLNAPVKARYVKLTVTRARTAYTDIGEIELYGY